MERREFFENVAVGTNIAMGYSLEDALAMLAGFGVEYVELSSIAGMCEHIDPSLIDEDYCKYVAALLKNNGLKCCAVSGHVDLTVDKQLEDFLKKIELTGRIGAKYINTNSGPLDRLDIFNENMKAVIEQAEKWNVIVNLESHGDIVSTAEDSVQYIKHFDHPLVRMNYDTGNTYFHSRGKCDVVRDIDFSSDVISYMHIKDVKITGNDVQYTPIGDGDLDFTAILAKVQKMGKKLPACLEIPVFVGGTLEGIGPRDVPMSPEMIKTAIDRSYAALDKALQSL